ncbi:ABC transporter permease [Actinocorallia aurea]
MLSYLRLEIVRALRDRRFLFFTLAFPVLLFLLLSSVYGGDGQTDDGTGLTAALYMMVAFGSYGAIGAALNSTGPKLALELRGGWLRQLRLTPLAAWKVIVVRIVTALVVALPSLALVGLAAALFQDVRMPAARWVVLIAVLALGTLPFAALGVLIGTAVKADVAQPVTLMLYTLMAIVGGLWLPVSQLPDFLQDVAPWTPANRMGELGWALVAGHAPDTATLGVLAGWTVALGALALVAYRRTTVSA